MSSIRKSNNNRTWNSIYQCWKHKSDRKISLSFLTTLLFVLKFSINLAVHVFFKMLALGVEMLSIVMLFFVVYELFIKKLWSNSSHIHPLNFLYISCILWGLSLTGCSSSISLSIGQVYEFCIGKRKFGCANIDMS